MSKYPEIDAVIPQPRESVRRILHEKRFQRFLCLTHDVPKTKGVCAWCGGQTPSPRLKYCSPACADEAMIRGSGQAVQAALLKRDMAVCADCGVDCAWLRRESLRVYRASSFEFLDPSWREQWGFWLPISDNCWHAHHIVPVSQGGGVCGLENYATLCRRCHRARHNIGIEIDPHYCKIARERIANTTPPLFPM